MHRKAVKPRYHGAARRIAVLAEQSLIVGRHIPGHLKHHLGHTPAFARDDVGVNHPGHMQHHVVIGAVAVVPVDAPARRPVVYLDVPNPHSAAYLHLRVEEVGPRVAVLQARVNHLYGQSVGRHERLQWEHLVLPCVL